MAPVNGPAAMREIQRKIGRNLVLYQQIERVLKRLVAVSAVAAPPGEMPEALDRRLESVHLDPMGVIKTKYLREFLRDVSNPQPQPNQGTDDDIFLSVTVQIDSNYHKEVSALLETVHRDRNELVHHLPTPQHSEHSERLLWLGQYLDEKHGRALQVFEILQHQLNGLQNAFKYQRFATKNMLFVLLFQYTQTNAKADGWVSIDAARNLLQRQAKDDLAAMSENHQCSNLQQLIESSDLFELREEPAKNGGKLFFYRSRPGAELPIE